MNIAPRDVMFVVIAMMATISYALYAGNKKKPAITVGSQAPDFSLPDEQGVLHTLSSMKGGKVALYFYPKDNTPGCTKQACSIRIGFSDLKEAGITVWGISFDAPQAHAAFKQKYALPFSLLSDSDKKVATTYGVAGWFFPDRVTFLINEQGIIVAIIKDVDVDNHAQQIVQAFKQSNN